VALPGVIEAAAKAGGGSNIFSCPPTIVARFWLCIHCTRVCKFAIRRMSLANPRWGAPRIHGELLKLGIEVSQGTVAKYMVRHRRPPSQTWRTFLRNHVKDLASTDFFVVPTATFRLLFVFVVLSHNRRRLVHFGVTSRPTAEWTAQQLMEAFPWDSAPLPMPDFNPRRCPRGRRRRDSLSGREHQRRRRGDDDFRASEIRNTCHGPIHNSRPNHGICGSE